jgi:plasmid stability protein
MPNLLVRNVDEDIVMALKAQAGEHGISVEAEHRQILQQALHRPKARSLLQVLMDIPDAGLDEDFLRTGGHSGRGSDVSD